MAKTLALQSAQGFRCFAFVSLRRWRVVPRSEPGGKSAVKRHGNMVVEPTGRKRPILKTACIEDGHAGAMGLGIVNK